MFCFREKHSLHVRRHYGSPAAYAFSCVPFASIRPGRRANLGSQRSPSLTRSHVGGLVSLPPALTPFSLWPKQEEEAPGEASPSRGRRDLSKPTVRAMPDGRELGVHGVASPDSPIKATGSLPAPVSLAIKLEIKQEDTEIGGAKIPAPRVIRSSYFIVVPHFTARTPIPHPHALLPL